MDWKKERVERETKGQEKRGRRSVATSGLFWMYSTSFLCDRYSSRVLVMACREQVWRGRGGGGEGGEAGGRGEGLGGDDGGVDGVALALLTEELVVAEDVRLA